MLKYFNINIFNYMENLENCGDIIAHTSEDGRCETLVEHINLCINYFEKIVVNKNLEDVFLGIEQILIPNYSRKIVALYREMIYHIVYLHDIGKINCNFQYYKMKNIIFKNMCSFDCNNSNHSMLSSMIYINEFYNKILQLPQNKETARLNIFLLLNAYVISKHHGNLDSFNEFKKKIIEPDGEMTLLYTEQTSIFNKTYKKEILKCKANNVLQRIVKIADSLINEEFKKNKEVSIDYYIYVKLMSSILLSCDYYATSEFQNNKEVVDFGEINNVEKLYDVYKTNEIYKSIVTYKNKKQGKKIDLKNVNDINILRDELFIEAQNTLENNISKDIYFLEAPTGSGKSMISFNLAFKLLEQSKKSNKIFYVYPFNTLVEQNINTLKKIFVHSNLINNISVVNSLVPFNKSYEIFENENEYSISGNVDYLKTLLDRQFLHYPIILTTHVSMFRFLFSSDKEALFPLAQIANSVMIFDEIQSYKNSLWKEIITFLSHYAKLLNIKIIIMSATLPDLCKLLDDTDVSAVNLINDRNKYFLNPVFKDRVKFDFSLMDVKENIFEKLMEHMATMAKRSGINILAEFISKKSAIKFYNNILNNPNMIKNKSIRLITGDDSSYERECIVEEFKTNKDIILIATQVIEAGVDLDADIGYKDISLFDSEEQFIGRINRNFSADRDKGIVYFFNLDDAGNIYKSDVRKEKIFTLENDEIKKLLINKDFRTYYSKILSHLISRTDVFNDFLETSVKPLDFKAIGKHMNLIDENYEYSVFLSRKIKINETEWLDGDEVWNNYIKILSNNDMEYSEKRVKLFDASALLNNFIYKIKISDFPYEQRIGDLFYISDGERYFENGKFNREKFENNIFI